MAYEGWVDVSIVVNWGDSDDHEQIKAGGSGETILQATAKAQHIMMGNLTSRKEGLERSMSVLDDRRVAIDRELSDLWHKGVRADECDVAANKIFECALCRNKKPGYGNSCPEDWVEVAGGCDGAGEATSIRYCCQACRESIRGLRSGTLSIRTMPCEM